MYSILKYFNMKVLLPDVLQFNKENKKDSWF